MARVVAVLAGLRPRCPGATSTGSAPRRVQTTRMAFHAIKAGEGDVFVSAGVECVSQYLDWAGAGGADEDAQNPLFADAEARTVETAKTQRDLDRPARGRACCPTSTSRWARPPRTSRRRAASPASAQDEWGVESARTAPRRPSPNGFFDREITPVTLPDGTVVSADDGPRAGRHHRGRQRPQAGVPPERHRHRRQLLPAQRRRRRAGRHERHQGRASSASRRSPGSSSTGVSGAVPRDHGPRPDRGRPSRPWPAPA